MVNISDYLLIYHWGGGNLRSIDKSENHRDFQEESKNFDDKHYTISFRSCDFYTYAKSD